MNANVDERNKIDTSEKHSRDLHANHGTIERQRDEENLYVVRNKQKREREKDIHIRRERI